MLRPLLDDDFPTAAALLAEGFPQHSRAFWDAALPKLVRYAGNEACGVPLGQLLVQEGQAVGVVLTPASQRRREDGTLGNLVNFSSWYIRPEHRWRALLMLRALLSDPDATYVDLTPTPQVEKLLEACGFRPVNDGTIVALLPACALAGAGDATVRDLGEHERLPDTAPPLSMLLAHRELGCIPLVLEHDAGQTLLVLRKRPLRGLPAARLKYIGSHAVLQRHLPSLARALLARGLLFLTWDARRGLPMRLGTLHRGWGTWYAKGEIVEDRTDFIGTELCVLGI